MNKSEKQRVEQATVRIKRWGGQGVLVPGEFVLTAAHCVNVPYTGGAVLGDYLWEEIETEKETFRMGIYAVEPVNDIAVLGAADNQELPGIEQDKYLSFIENTKPVPIYMSKLPSKGSLEVHVFTHLNKWNSGELFYRGIHGNAHIKFHKKIIGGTSGSPIVSSEGELIGLVSNTSEEKVENRYEGTCPLIRFALPVWLIARILENQKSIKRKLVGPRLGQRIKIPPLPKNKISRDRL